MTDPNPLRSTRAPEPRPYTSPRLICYGHIKDIVQGDGGKANDGGGDHSKACWIAEALYGVDAPRTLLVRSWLTRAADCHLGWLAFVRTYSAIGRGLAASIRRGRLPRAPFAWLFERLVRRAGADFLRRIPTGVHPGA
jgi:hypothetical protein